MYLRDYYLDDQNWIRWSDITEPMIPAVIFSMGLLYKILSIVFEWPVTIVGVLKGKKNKKTLY